MPAAWAGVTVRQLLGHTSGLPDYTRSDDFAEHVRTAPGDYVRPREIIDWVRADRLVFAPGSGYAYSNTDNIVIGLIARAVTGTSYRALLNDIVVDRARLRATSFPTERITLPRPFIHGYAVAPGEPARDVTTFLSPSGAWASGAVVSTPTDLNAFIRAYLGRRFFGTALQREQMRFVPGGRSSPPGPGRNAAGLALFRYRTRCGTAPGSRRRRTVHGTTRSPASRPRAGGCSPIGSRATTTSGAHRKARRPVRRRRRSFVLSPSGDGTRRPASRAAPLAGTRCPAQQRRAGQR